MGRGESDPTGTHCTDVEPRIFVVVPVHNRKALTARFLECIEAQTYKNFKVIVVDDGSRDGTAEFVTLNYPGVDLLHGDGSLWWTGSINCGIRHALAHASERDAILVINDDLEVDADYLNILSTLWTSFPNTLIGSVAVDIKNPGRIVDGGTVVNWWTAKFVRLNYGKALGEFDPDYYVDVSLLPGRGVLIPISVFHDIGLYDEKHFQQYGDTELPVRAKNRGYPLIVAYGAVVKVHTEATSDINATTSYALGDILEYFFGIKSSARLRERFYFGYSAAKNPLAFVSYLLFDFTRLLYHFIARLRLT